MGVCISKQCGKVTSFLKTKDQIANPVGSRLHLSGSKNSILGGLVSLVISLYLGYSLVFRTYEMIVKNSPATASKF